MNKTILINIIILCICAIFAYAITVHFTKTRPPVKSVPTAASEENTDQMVSEFIFTDIKGQTHSITSFKDKKIILNFWASWCAPCVKEFPLLLKAAEDNADDTVLIALSSDINEELVINFVKKMENTQGISMDKANVFIAKDPMQEITTEVFQTYKLPETILIDKNQVMRHKFVGANWDAEDMQNELDKL